MSDLPFDQDNIYDWIPNPNEKHYEFRRLNCKFENKIALISMICFMFQMTNKSGKQISFQELIEKLAPEDTTKTLKNELVDLCLTFYNDKDTYNNYGMKSAKEIKSAVQEILNTELPF